MLFVAGEHANLLDVPFPKCHGFMDIIFTIFKHFMESWVSFQEIFHILDSGPDFHSICGIMALRLCRIDGIVGANLLGKMACPPIR